MSLSEAILSLINVVFNECLNVNVVFNECLNVETLRIPAYSGWIYIPTRRPDGLKSNGGRAACSESCRLASGEVPSESAIFRYITSYRDQYRVMVGSYGMHPRCTWYLAIILHEK